MVTRGQTLRHEAIVIVSPQGVKPAPMVGVKTIHGTTELLTIGGILSEEKIEAKGRPALTAEQKEREAKRKARNKAKARRRVIRAKGGQAGFA